MNYDKRRTRWLAAWAAMGMEAAGYPPHKCKRFPAKDGEVGINVGPPELSPERYL